MTDTLAREEEIQALELFRISNPDLFRKEDTKLLMHLGIILSLFFLSITFIVAAPFLWLRMILGIWSAFLLFSLINVTIHHHHTHHNATDHPICKRLLDFLYLIVLPNAPRRLSRYTRAHLNHHARPFHETDVDHHYGTERYLHMKRNFWTRLIYFMELTFVGAHMPGWEDDRYMNQVPLEQWNRVDYQTVKHREKVKALQLSLIQWTLFGILLWLFPVMAWAWAFPMLLVKNWAHFLGQFQHYDERFMNPALSIRQRTKTYQFPSWLNYLAGGEISGHFVHHLFPEIPYYKVEETRKRLLKDPGLLKLFVTY